MTEIFRFISELSPHRIFISRPLSLALTTKEGEAVATIEVIERLKSTGNEVKRSLAARAPADVADEMTGNSRLENPGKTNSSPW